MHWADSFAKEIIETRAKGEYVVESGITPSGVVHIGNAREIMTQFFVHQALLKLGKQSKFQYMWDDYDRFRKVPKGVPEEFKKYLGLPVSKVPDPFGCHKSYAEHSADVLVKELKHIGVFPVFLSATELYESCAFAENIKTALENVDKIKAILNSERKEPLEQEWLPIHVYCEQCHKDTTKAKYLGDYDIEYECECGFSNRVDFRKVGCVKLSWRVDWPSRWAHFGVDFESAGKDHMASGGSWDTGILISKEVFGYEPPVGTMYEFIYIKGQKEKMSKSVGNVATLSTLLTIYEPEVIRFLYTQRLKKAIYVPFDTDIYSIYDLFDAAEKSYYDLQEDEEETKRRYELSQIERYKKCPTRIPFSELVNLIQTVSPNKVEAQLKVILAEKNKDFTGEDLQMASSRLKKAQFWLDEFAPVEVKVALSNEPFEIPVEYKRLIAKIAERISELDDEEAILQEAYEMTKAAGFKPKDIFGILYKALINKERGPRFGILVMILGKKEVVERLRKLAE
jgi:lysyl-tRNA synthetase class 1